MPTLQATATTALVPIGVPVSRPRRVSVAGVNGWYSANWREPGRHRRGEHEAAAEERAASVRNIGVLLAVSTLLAARPSAVASQISANANSVRRPIEASQSSAPAVGAEAERDGDAEHDADADEGLDEAGEHVAGEDGGAGDRHRAEAVDDASGHVHRDDDRGALDGGGDGHEQDPGRDVVEVAGAPGVPAGERGAEPVAELTAEDVDEQQQEHDRHADEEQRHRRVAQQTPKVAAQHRRGVADGVGEGAHQRCLLFEGRLAGHGEEDVVEVGPVDRELLDLDRARRRAARADDGGTRRRRFRARAGRVAPRRVSRRRAGRRLRAGPAGR